MMVTVASFSFPHEAHIARASLEAAGIPAVVADEHTISMQWLYSNALGGVKVQVPERVAVQARDALQEDHGDSLANEQGYDELRCPKCGSVDTEFWVRGKKAAFLVFIVLQFPLWPFKREIKCHDCEAVSEYRT